MFERDLPSGERNDRSASRSSLRSAREVEHTFSRLYIPYRRPHVFPSYNVADHHLLRTARRSFQAEVQSEHRNPTLSILRFFILSARRNWCTPNPRNAIQPPKDLAKGKNNRVTQHRVTTGRGHFSSQLRKIMFETVYHL